MSELREEIKSLIDKYDIEQVVTTLGEVLEQRDADAIDNLRKKIIGGN